MGTLAKILTIYFIQNLGRLTDAQFPPNIPFDYVSYHEDFDGTYMDIGWIRFLSCTEGKHANATFTFQNPLTMLLDISQYAITVKFLPSTDVPDGNTENTAFSVKSKICSSPIYALNNGYELSYILDTTTSVILGYPDPLNWPWLGSPTAQQRMQLNTTRGDLGKVNNYLGPTYGELPWHIINGSVFGAYGNLNGIHIFYDIPFGWDLGKRCEWDYSNDKLGEDIVMWVGFDLQKQTWCEVDGSGSYVLNSFLINTPTPITTTNSLQCNHVESPDVTLFIGNNTPSASISWTFPQPIDACAKGDGFIVPYSASAKFECDIFGHVEYKVYYNTIDCTNPTSIDALSVNSNGYECGQNACSYLTVKFYRPLDENNTQCNQVFPDYTETNLIMDECLTDPDSGQMFLFTCFAVDTMIQEMYFGDCIGTPLASLPIISGCNPALDNATLDFQCTPKDTTMKPIITTTTPTIKPIITTTSTFFTTTISPTKIPSVVPSNYPTITTNNPTKIPSKSPTQITTNPSKYPSQSPSENPSKYPTEMTMNPSQNPSKYPTQSPSENPSKYPSQNPSENPSKYPTETPSIPPTEMTMNPSDNPTESPIANPTHSPSIPPTFSPSQTPTVAPTDERHFDSKFWIKYLIKKLENEYIDILLIHLLDILHDISQIITESYFEIVGVNIELFALEIEDILDSKTDEITDDIIQMSKDKISFSGIIKCDNKNCKKLRNLNTKSKLEFESNVQAKLRAYFPNYLSNINVNAADEGSSEVTFEIEDHGKLEWIYPPDATTLELLQENKVLFVVCGIMILMLFISIFAYLHEQSMCCLPGGYPSDDTMFYSCLIYGLQMIVLIADINLCCELVLHDEFETDLKIKICGILSIIFISVPYIVNLLFGLNIRKYISQENKNAISFFKERKYVFLLLIACCGGCFPSLVLLSSGIFGHDAVCSGLMGYEVRKMSKIKIISTIFLQNIPQIFIQCFYSVTINKITDNALIAFVISILSILFTPIRLKRYKNTTPITCFLDIKIMNDQDNERTQKIKFMSKKGKINKLANIICDSFGWPHKSIEISRNSNMFFSMQFLKGPKTTSFGSGVIFYVAHLIGKNDGNEYNINEIVKLYHENEHHLKNEFKLHFDLLGACTIKFRSADSKLQIVINEKSYPKNVGTTTNMNTQIKLNETNNKQGYYETLDPVSPGVREEEKETKEYEIDDIKQEYNDGEEQQTVNIELMEINNQEKEQESDV